MKPEKKSGTVYVQDGYDEHIGHYELTHEEFIYNQACDDWEKWIRDEYTLSEEELELKVSNILRKYIPDFDYGIVLNIAKSIRAEQIKRLEGK